MRTRVFALTLLLCTVALAPVGASGQAGIYGIIERVVFEPNAQAPERVQLWGAFALVERMMSAYPGLNNMTEVQGQFFTNYPFGPASRGYIYFKLPPAAPDIANAKREWADLASIAGTKQAVAFGLWDRFRGDTRLMTIRAASVAPSDPDVYLTNLGVAKLPAAGSHAAIVQELVRLLGK
jgi:hypothetical protein